MTLHRRTLLAAAAMSPLAAQAHHGWSSFDQEAPIYLEGNATNVRWVNPHVELKLALPKERKMPADLALRAVPKQTAPVDGAALLAKARWPKRTDALWEVELAPLTRMQAWNVPEIKAGQALAVLGFTFANESGQAVLRAEYLWLEGKTYALRSSPA